MKNLFVKVLCFVIVLSLCFVLTEFTQAEEVESIYTITDSYQYPIVPGMEEWKKLKSLQEKIEVCHIPEDVLTNMTTEALIETVLNYPLAINIVAYDTPQIGLKEVTKYFNGLQELSTRVDARKKIEMIISKNDFNINADRLKKVFLSVLSGNYQNRSIVNQYVIQGSIHYDYTPAGSKVQLIYNSTWADHGMDATGGAYWQAHYKTAYPDAIVIASENPAYNCHSYTFVNASTSNKYWLQPSYASYYINDGSYSVVSPARAGDKVWYGSYHSAIVKSISSGTVTVRSKWGYAGLFEHKVADCPYSSNYGVTYYR